MALFALRGILGSVASRRFASSSAAGKSEKPPLDPDDPHTPKLPDIPLLYPAFDPEVDTTSKTTVKILNDDEEGFLLVNAYSQSGFRLSNGATAMGPIALFPKSVFQWNVKNLQSLTPEAFSLFYLLDPKIDILVIGLGDRGNTLPQELMFGLMNKRRLGLEILPTEHAVTTFNWLNSERRYVAGAFFPPKTINYSEDDLYRIAYNRSSLRTQEEAVDDAVKTAPRLPRPSRLT